VARAGAAGLVALALALAPGGSEGGRLDPGTRLAAGEGGEAGRRELESFPLQRSDGRALAMSVGVGMGDLLSSEAARRAAADSSSSSRLTLPGPDPSRDKSFLDRLFLGQGRRRLEQISWSGGNFFGELAADAASRREESRGGNQGGGRSSSPRRSRDSEEDWLMRLLNPFSPEENT